MSAAAQLAPGDQPQPGDSRHGRGATGGRFRHQPWVLNIAVRMVWDRADAEDATQEILIKVLKARSERG